MTIAATSPLQTQNSVAPRPGRSAGALAIALGIASFVLLALHPGGEARDFAGVLKEEAGNQLANAVVHGGFIVVLALLTVCYALFSVRAGLPRMSAVAGLVLFAAGAAFMCASLVVDGLVTPAVAARYLAKPEKIDFAKSLFVLMGSFVTFVMPLGLALQAAGIAAWGWAAIASGLSRAAGVIGLLLGGLMIAALAASFATANPMLMMGALAASSLWALTVGAVLLRGETA